MEAKTKPTIIHVLVWWKSRIVRAIRKSAGAYALTADIDDVLSQPESG